MDHLQHILYYDLEHERSHLSDAINEALLAPAFDPMDFENWCRIVTYKHSNAPLSAMGSLTDVGGRFNIGRDVDCVRGPFPALYIAESYGTAYREKFGLSHGELIDGLTPEELALVDQSQSTANVRIRGHIEKVFDIRDPHVLEPFCRVIAKIKQPRLVKDLSQRLKLRGRKLMIRSTSQLGTALSSNWRGVPVQFGLPSTSQIFAKLVLDAGYEAIRYSSTKNPTKSCLAVFPSNLGSDKTYVELVDEHPPNVSHSRLCLDTCEDLCGWTALAPSMLAKMGIKS